MASSYLVVHVGDANVPSSSSTTPGTSYYVELRFNGQSARTEMKENARWNHVIRFPRREQQQGDIDDGDEGHHASGSGGLDLEAAVYSIDEATNSESLLGKAVVDEKDFDSHSSKAVFFPHELVKSSSSDHMAGHTGPGRLVNGKLTLKVFHSPADDKALLFEIEDDNRDRQAEDGGVDKVKKKAFGFLFSIKNHLYSAAYNKTSSAVGNTALLQPAGDDADPKEINPSFECGKVVERMQFLFVLVVKARELPDVDAYGRLDPFVEVNFGAHNKGFTKCLKSDGSPEWNKTFAFSLQSGKAPPSSGVDVFVKDGDLVRDELVGKLYFYLKDIPVRHPDDAQPEPTWHPLLDEGGKATLGKASLLLAIWIGSQADEAYRHAWESPFGPKVYENPRLWCLRVTIVEVQGVVACDEDDAGSATARSLRDKLFCTARLGEQVRKTKLASKTMQTTSSGSYEWMEDLTFIAAQPFFESNLQVDVVAAASNNNSGTEELQQGEVIGKLSIPLAWIEKRDAAAYDFDRLATPTPQWFDLKNPSPARPHTDLGGSSVDEGVVGGSGSVSHMRIRLRSLLDGGYHIGHDPQGHMDDTRPAERQLWRPPITRVHLGILRATGLQSIVDGNTTRRGRRSTALNPYCVAKYGDKWVRTRTILESSDPVFNEEYTWDVYDIATVLKVGIFDHCSRKASSAHHVVGKVRIHLSCLETGRIYAHAYPLVTLSRSAGIIRTGVLHLAVKISSPPSTMNMLRMYALPTLPRMHYAQPLQTAAEGYKLWLHAANILALRLGRMEPPLRREVVAYLCNAENCNNSSWSLRRSKANFNRLMQVISPLIGAERWFGGVISWKNPLTTLLIHAILVLALWFLDLVLPLVLLYLVLRGVWNYRRRPRRPPYFCMVLSYVNIVHPDELDEEFDTVKTSLSDDDGLLRMRYDRLREVAGRIQTVVGDVATLFERFQSLLTWRDPRVTAIFMLFLLLAAALAYFVPYKKLLVAMAGFYIMRHPRLRRRRGTKTTPSIITNFFLRSPSKRDELM